MLTVWGRRSAFNVQKVLWLLGELGLAHRWIDAGGDAGGLDTPEFLAMNPNGRVPVIEDDGLAVWESHAILRYLAARHGGEGWWPFDAAARSLIDRWMDWSQAELQPAMMGLFWGFYRTPEEQRNQGVIHRHLAACRHCYGLLDSILADNPYLAGGGFSLADMPAGVTLYRYVEMGIDAPLPDNVQAWYARLAERPTYREHVMRPFAELKGRLDY